MKKLPGWEKELIGVFVGLGFVLLPFLFKLVFTGKVADFICGFLVTFGFLTALASLIALDVRSIKALQSGRKEKQTEQPDSCNRALYTELVAGGIFVILSLFDAISDSGTIGTIALILSVAAIDVLIIVFIIHGIKALNRRLKGEHAEPAARTYIQADSGVRVDDLEDGVVKKQEVFVYNHDETFRFNKDAAPLSWGFIIFMLILFFPYGFFLLIVKTINERGKAFRNGAALQTLGTVILVLFLGFALLIALTGADSRQAFIAFVVFPFVISVMASLLIAFGSWLKRRGREEDTCRSLITMEGITSIDALADRCDTNYAYVSAIIDRLIDAELLGDAYLSHEDREVIVPGISEKIARRCRNCGGTTVLFSNDPRICEYCGGTI